MKLHRIVTQDEPIEGITVSQDTKVEVEFTLYDDLGAYLDDDLLIKATITMARGSAEIWESEYVTISGGAASIELDEAATGETGDFEMELLVSDAESTPTVFFIIGTLDFVVEAT